MRLLVRRNVAFVRSITAKPVAAVVITHWHNDHPQGVSAIRDAFPRVRIIAYGLTPMVENAWREARGEPIVQGEGESRVSGPRRRVRR